MTVSEILDEINRLSPTTQAEITRLVANRKRPLTSDELEDLAQEMIDEKDPARAEALRQELIEGFYGGDVPVE